MGFLDDIVHFEHTYIKFSIIRKAVKLLVQEKDKSILSLFLPVFVVVIVGQVPAVLSRRVFRSGLPLLPS